MILVDTSIWVDHLRAGDLELQRQLAGGNVLGHPWVIGELALGNLRQREEVIGLLGSLPTAVVATPRSSLSSSSGTSSRDEASATSTPSCSPPPDSPSMPCSGPATSA